MSSEYKHLITVCWQEKSPVSDRAELLASLLRGERSQLLESLPVEEIAAQVIKTFDKGGRLPRRDGNTIVWRNCGAVHKLVIYEQYFTYGYGADHSAPEVTQGVRFESLDLPEIAGRFGCIVYFAESGSVLLRPLGTGSTRTLAFGQPGEVLQLSCFEYKSSYFDFCTALFKFGPKAMEQKTGLVFEDGIEDLGLLSLAVVRVGSHEYFLQWIDTAMDEVEVRLPVGTADPGEALDSLLCAFRFTSEDLTWVADSVKFTEHEFWRQDDNGNKFLIEKTRCRADAMAKLRPMEESGHKQFYWVVPCDK